MNQLLLAVIALFSGTALLAQNSDCPTIRLNSGQMEYKDGETANFGASVIGSGNYTYNWSVSAGSISSGQGTSSITVNTKGQADNSITATVELGGAPRECYSTQSSTVIVTPAPKIMTKTKAKKVPAKTKTIKKTKT